MKFSDLLDQVPIIASFQSSDSVLHLPDSNLINVNGSQYELRMLAFKTTQPNCPDLATFASTNNLRDKEFESVPQISLVHVQSLIVKTVDTYLIISIRPLD